MSITHEPRRQRYVVTVGSIRRLSTYGEGCPRAEAHAFARELERELITKAEIARAFAEEAAQLALEARAVLADEQAEAEAWAQAAETCDACCCEGETFEQADGRLLCAGCAGFRAPGRFGRFERDVYDFAANRWYCTAASWPYSPAARAGAEVYEVAA